MDVAPDGSVALAYYAYTARDLIVATRTASATGWVVERVATAADVGAGASVAIGADGTLHVSYYDLHAGRLQYARKAPGGTWTFEAVDSFNMVVSGRSSLKLDAQGHPRVAFWAHNSLRYAERSATGWASVEVDPIAGDRPELVLDEAGDPHITYSVSGNQSGAALELLKYATRSAGAWSRQNLYQSNGTAAVTESSLAFDAQGTLHVLYYASNWLELRHLQKPAGGNWSAAMPLARPSAGDGRGMSLRLAPDGKLHGTWKTLFSREVVFATWNAGTWSHEIVDTAPAPQALTVLGFDANSRPHVAWWTKNPGDAVRFSR
ncbi:MAG: hypothetical protein WBV82_09545 [Myxococcaceae bacterium]